MCIFLRVPPISYQKTDKQHLNQFFLLIRLIFDMWGLMFDLPILLQCVMSKVESNCWHMQNLDPNRAHGTEAPVKSGHSGSRCMEFQTRMFGIPNIGLSTWAWTWPFCSRTRRKQKYEKTNFLSERKKRTPEFEKEISELRRREGTLR